MIPAVLAVVLGITAVAAFYRRAWTIAAMAGLLALGAIWIATEPLGPPARPAYVETP